MGKVRCCQEPGRSVNRTETNFALCQRHTSRQSLGSCFLLSGKGSVVLDFAPYGCLVRSCVELDGVSRAKKRHEPRIKKRAL